MEIDIYDILCEISDLNALDNKVLTERIVKFNEEFGEYNAEICKLIGITHKPYDKDHLLEESADFLQNAFSVLIETCKKSGFTMEDIFEQIKVKNQKWRAKAPLYTKNQTYKISVGNIPESESEEYIRKVASTFKTTILCK